MRTIKILPSINNVDLCGRLVSDPILSANGNVMLFSVIRNFGGDKEPIVMTFVYFKPKNGFPEFLKKGALVIAHAYQTPNVWTDKDGAVHEDVQKVIKNVELAETVDGKAPGINNLDFCGRVTSDPFITKDGKVMRFRLIRNFGGEKPPVLIELVYFKPEEGFPEFIKKGAPVTVHAYYTPNVWTDKDGVEHKDVQKVIKSAEPAQLVEKTIEDNSPEAAEAEDADGEEPEIKTERD